MWSCQTPARATYDRLLRNQQRKRWMPNSFRTRYLSPYGSGFSIEPRILQSARFRPHSVSEEAKGMYLVGAGTHPGAGLPGMIASAEVLGKLVADAPHRANLMMAAE